MNHLNQRHIGEQSNRFDTEQKRQKRSRAFKALRHKLGHSDVWASVVAIVIGLSLGGVFSTMEGSSTRYGSTPQINIQQLIDQQRRIQEMQKNSLAIQQAINPLKYLPTRPSSLDYVPRSPLSPLPLACLPPEEVFDKARAEEAIKRRIARVGVCDEESGSASP